MQHYTEQLRTVLNSRGVERGDPTLSTWLFGEGAEHFGFDGDGTKGGATLRLWRSKADLSPLLDGIAEISETEFDDAIAAREAAKPIPPPPPPDPEPPLTDDEIVELRALLGR